MDHIDIKIRFRPEEDPILFSKLVSMNKRHRAELVRTYSLIGHTFQRLMQGGIPNMSGQSSTLPLNVSSPFDNRTKERNASEKEHKGESQISGDELTEFDEAVVEMLKNSSLASISG